MPMPLRIADRKPKCNIVQERRVGDLPRFVPRNISRRGSSADSGRSAPAGRRSRLIGAAVRIGDARITTRPAPALSARRVRPQFPPRACRYAYRAHGSKAAHEREAGRWKSPADRAAAPRSGKSPQSTSPFPSRYRSVAGARNREGPIAGVTADADDVGKAEFGAIGIVDALEGFVFGIRQPVKPEAILLGGEFGRQLIGAFGLVGQSGGT